MSERITEFVRWYGYGGLIPFVGLTALTAASVTLPFSLQPVDLFLYWSAIILSFMAAIIWGLALFVSGIKEKPALTVAVALTILGWVALLLPTTVSLLLLIAAFAGLWRFEQTHAFKQVYSCEYRRLRSQLTAVVILCHLIILVIA
ncbi:DUF3429 domain-containing protein [Salinibius halmophilus]|uniref:DUF3429 domain-containing protein n=1 Tax=Salinibius halmophilus TaxID=1853216 RepID=UPI000E6644F2|nr:DUF3429 domain-containing protein [Salinibius halmophilus]